MSYRLEIGLALLFALALGVVVWAGSRHSRIGELDFRSSTFLTGPRGSKALYDVLSQLGRRTERRRTKLDNVATARARRPAILAVLNPVIPMTDTELEQVVRFVRGGGAVVASGWGGGIAECLGWRIQPEFRADSIAVRAPGGLRLPRAARVLAPLQRDTSGRSELQNPVKLRDEVDAPGICNTLAPFAVDTIVAAVNNRPVILRLRYRGGGTVTLAADPGWFTNRVWRDTDVPVIALALFSPAREHPGLIVWDEYHQGFGEETGPSLTGQTWRWLRQSPTAAPLAARAPRSPWRRPRKRGRCQHRRAAARARIAAPVEPCGSHRQRRCAAVGRQPGTGDAGAAGPRCRSPVT
ncbi:MAG: hypothetical protein AUI09_02825 [Gemmatimonadetes bacterium 13_2_20CM_2_66_5]|nr:MAG: hypothetical protein AUI09_02825 [Gemmatimonadetes bacterium 13_2_20CM_2_66_5]